MRGRGEGGALRPGSWMRHEVAAAGRAAEAPACMVLSCSLPAWQVDVDCCLHFSEILGALTWACAAAFTPALCPPTPSRRRCASRPHSDVAGLLLSLTAPGPGHWLPVWRGAGRLRGLAGSLLDRGWAGAAPPALPPGGGAGGSGTAQQEGQPQQGGPCTARRAAAATGAWVAGARAGGEGGWRGGGLPGGWSREFCRRLRHDRRSTSSDSRRDGPP